MSDIVVFHKFVKRAYFEYCYRFILKIDMILIYPFSIQEGFAMEDLEILII